VIIAQMQSGENGKFRGFCGLNQAGDSIGITCAVSNQETQDIVFIELITHFKVSG
jgi:hypothetical protein